MPKFGFDDAKVLAMYKSVGDALDAEEPAQLDDPVLEAEASLQQTYQSEMAQGGQMDKLKELKVKMAVEAYEKRRPADVVMNHYWIKEAGDAMAIGEYVPTGDWRFDAPVYRNEHGLVLSRERQPLGPETDQEVFGWVIGNMEERRPLYGVASEDLSVPTLGWQAFTAPEPVPIIRYFTAAAAARKYKEKGNRAFQKRDWAQAEDWYGKSLNCQMDAAEYAESYAMLFSNRAEVRLRTMNFSGALGDAENAMKFLKGVFSEEEPTLILKQKTALRLAKAMMAVKQFDDAKRVLSEGRRNFPKNAEMERLLEEVSLALKAEAKQASGRASGATPGMLGFVSKAMEAIQAEIGAAGDAISELVFPASLSTELKKLEYLLTKAKQVQGECLVDLQTVLRTSGGMRTLLQLTAAQWKSNLDGKAVDAYKCQAATSVATLVSLLCEGNVENLRLAAEYAFAFYSLLGGCNRKCEAGVCEKLVSLTSGLWEHCKAKTTDLVQTHSIVVERCAAFLSKAALAEPGDDAGGPDSPPLAPYLREKAVAMIYDLLACGGRIEKRALRGLVPQLASADGEGYFTSEEASVRALGELVALKAMADPQLLAAKDVKNLLFAVQLLIMAGPGASANKLATVPQAELAGEGAVMRYVDLKGFEETDEGKSAALLLQVLSKSLEYRLYVKDRELEKDDFEDAFLAGSGYFVVVPLVQGPAAFAEPALLCLAVLAQSRTDNVHHIISLSTVHALFGLPTPESKPMPTSVEQTLKTSLVARRDAAKLLSMCIDTEAVIALLEKMGEKCIKELVKLASQIRMDGTLNAQAFHDMINVFYVISQSKPGPLCHMPVDMMNLLVDLGAVKEGTIINEYASAIVKVLRKDKSTKQVIKAAMARVSGEAVDQDDELLNVTSKMIPWFAHR
mmetsp:Transcript_32308/g.68816  ORF Transcript_32308/g.68816 Transcript_32308/m.68816 type:complete len:906 (-) Transcript_32308:73-2790(-)